MKKLYGNQCIFIICMIAGGFITGIIGSMIADPSMFSTLDSFLLPISHTFDQHAFFLTTFLQQLLFVILIAFLGTSAIGTLPLAFILFVKGVQVGCTSMMFLYTYQLKGIAGIILTLFPLALMDLLPIMIMGVYAMDCSSHVLYACLNKEVLQLKKEVDFGLNCMLISLVLVLIFSFGKATIIIELIRFFISF